MAVALAGSDAQVSILRRNQRHDFFYWTYMTLFYCSYHVWT